MIDWWDATAVATAIAGSIQLTAWLSATHMLAFVLVLGTAVVVNLRFVGALLPTVGVAEIARTAQRVLLIGLAVSVASGFLLTAGRLSALLGNDVFRLKLSLLAVAACVQIVLHAWIARRAGGVTPWLEAGGAAGLLLWLGLAVTACWFILFE